MNSKDKKGAAPKVKVCGMRDERNIGRVAGLFPDFMGFIFYNPSPRDCTGITPDIIRQLPAGVKSVAVTVDMPEKEVLGLVNDYGIDAVQLHGKESPEMCRRLRDRGIIVLKALGIKDKDSVRRSMEYEGCVDFFVFDTATPSKGGSGKKFSWELLDEYKGLTPFLLSGGIGEDDLESLRNISHPAFAGVDLNSRFEISPALKDEEKLEKFIKELRK